MSHEDQIRVLFDLSRQLASGDSLTESQQQYLSTAFYKIASGEDANKVLGTRPNRGESLSALIARRRMSLILHWVAGAINPDPSTSERAMTVSEACAAAMTTIVPLAKEMFPGAENRIYDAEYIERCWSEPAYKHMRSTERGWFDQDYPFYELPQVKDLK